MPKAAGILNVPIDQWDWLFDRAVLCWLATSSPRGEPSVSPKEIFLRRGEQILIANIASPNSARNVTANPSVCVALLDVFVQKGAQFYGRAELITAEESRFGALSSPLEELAGEAFPFESLFCVTPERVKPIVAPRYTLFPDSTEDEQVISAMRTYGVRPAP